MKNISTPFIPAAVLLTAAITIAGCDSGTPGTGAPAGTSSIAVTSARADAAEAAEDAITADYLRDQVTALSSDAFEGRGTASPGDAKACEYLIDQLKQMGLQPGGPDGEWEQVFDVVGITSDMPKTWTFEHGRQRLALKWWDQYIGASGVQANASRIKNAEVVFVGYGIQAPEYEWDDFKGQDLKGKVLLMLNNDPDWDPALFEGNTRLYYGRWTYKYESAARQGAAGAIIIHTTPSAGYPFQVVQTSWSGEQFELPAGDEPRIQVAAWVTEDAARNLVAIAGKDLDALVQSARSRDFTPVPLGIQTSIDFTNRLNRTSTMNVYGVMPGSDPVLGKEAVIYTAHHDHLGIGEPDADGDTIYNGALDNGAGMAQVLGIARAFAALPAAPRRSVMFLFVGAEEQGTLGSEYYAAHPTYAPGRIAANLNFDGGDIWGRARDITFIGKGKSSLDTLVEKYAAVQHRVVKPDQFPDRGYFYRSDQISFAKIGVPATFFDTGTEFIGRPEGWGRQQVEDYEAHRYHQPGDEIDASWNFGGMIEDARIGFRVGLDVANADAMPSWNPGDEFEGARKAALEALSGTDQKAIE